MSVKDVNATDCEKVQTEPKILQTWPTMKALNNRRVESSDIKPPTPYPPNRRKPGVALPNAGRLPFKIMLNDKCPDIEKEPVKSLKEVEPLTKSKKANAKGKNSKKGKKK